MVDKPIISIIIVNYNVRDFLEQSLISVRRALKNISSEIIIVDNASIDGSVAMLKQRFSDIHVIESKKIEPKKMFQKQMTLRKNLVLKLVSPK